MAKALSCFFLICLCLCPISAAQARTANFTGMYLLQLCESDNNGVEKIPAGHTACQAYLAGIIDYHNFLRTINNAPGLDFCIPRGTSMYDIQDKMVAYMKRNPQHYPYQAAPAVLTGLSITFPCR